MLGICVDITERKQVEEALMRSERKYRLLHESMIDGFVTVNMGGNFLEFNEVYRNMLGYSEAELAQLTYVDITPEKWHVFEADILENQILKRGYSDIYEKEYIRKDGTVFPVELRTVLLCDEQERPVGMWAIVRDITERKQAEKTLRENQELFSLFMRHSPIYTFIKEVTPTESRVLQASENYQEMIGIKGKDMVGKAMAELFPPEFAAKITADDWAVVSNGETLKLDEELNGRNYISIKFPIIQGDKTLLAGYTIDITERVQVEDELRHARELLTAVNIELQTALIREKQLAHTDVLTGVNNRRYLFELGEHEFEVAGRYQKPLSVVMFDIDHFKNVNDTFGHTVGDQILELVAQVACAELRSADVIGRYGGEEFVLILPMTEAQQAYQLAERIRAGVTAIRVPTPKGVATVTLSIGIVEMIHSSQTESIEDLIRRSDEAMYAAKQAGRNRTEIRS
jgi:diguanylate cyclase (GGDEF)-like protein/PAS domain S-box-containing protein